MCIHDRLDELTRQIPYDPTSPAADMVEGLLINGVDGVSFGGRDLLYVHLISSLLIRNV